MNPAVRATLTRHRSRVATIVGTLGDYGLAQWLPSGLPSNSSRSPDDLKDLPIEVRMRMALSELGPVFVKLGQMREEKDRR